ncbi:hypothetical protein ABW20_dc0103325 [Dactylellina cionopaga]|nr:hypothetical protein ABW20_dc0103325 [Dactylellina cionopaga]
MKEGREKSVLLDSEVDHKEAFEMFVQYCYIQDYFCGDNPARALVCHARVYVLAEKIDFLPLKKLAFKKANIVVSKAYSDGPDDIFAALPTAIALIYQYTHDAQVVKNLTSKTNGTTSNESPDADVNTATAGTSASGRMRTATITSTEGYPTATTSTRRSSAAG